ncbi:MAG: hypothetical protein ACTHKG_07195 [Nocardioides sp.]
MRLTKIAVPAAAVMMALGGASIAAADPGPNGHNTFGLCTAYFAGSEKGQEMKRHAPPFQGLEEAASAADQSVEEYCAANGTHPGQGSGKPSS